MYLDRQRYTVFWSYTICRPNTKTNILTEHQDRHTHCQFFFLHVAIRNSLRSNYVSYRLHQNAHILSVRSSFKHFYACTASTATRPVYESAAIHFVNTYQYVSANIRLHTEASFTTRKQLKQ